MENFLFCNPVKIIFGKGAELNAGKETLKYGKKALLVYGRSSIKKSGLYGKITENLKSKGVEFIEHSGVKSNPALLHVKEGIEKVKSDNCDVIIAVGGGSVIDEAKAIAAGTKYDGDVWDFFTGKAGVKAALPIITVLTLAATGSEMNQGCVVTKEDAKQKLSVHSPHVFPKVSMLNPELTASVSREYTAYGVIDALSHVFEGYFTTQTDSAFITDEICEGICRTLIKSMNILHKDLSDYNARANIMWSATLALNSLQRVGYKNTEFINHAIEHSLSAIYDIPHGAGLSIVMPSWFKFQISKRKTKRIAKFGRNVFSLSGEDEKALAKETVSEIEKWFSSIGAPITLSEVNIPEKDIPLIAESVMETIKLWGMSYAKKSIEEILRKAA